MTLITAMLARVIVTALGVGAIVLVARPRERSRTASRRSEPQAALDARAQLPHGTTTCGAASMG